MKLALSGSNVRRARPYRMERTASRYGGLRIYRISSHGLPTWGRPLVWGLWAEANNS
jgi:hypothetical protein